MSKAQQACGLYDASAIGTDAAEVIFESLETLKTLGDLEKVPKDVLENLQTAAAAVNLASTQTKKNTAGLGGTGTSYAAERLASAKRRSGAAEALGDSDVKKGKLIAFRPALFNITNAVALQDTSKLEKQKAPRTPSTEMGRKKRSGSKYSPVSPIPGPKDGPLYTAEGCEAAG